MASPQSVAVRVIYDSSQRRRRGPVAYTSRRSGTRPLLILGFLNFLVAAALYYGVWQKVDSLIYITLLFKTPIVTDVPQAEFESSIAQMFGMQLSDEPVHEPPTGASTESAVSHPASTWSGSTTQKLVPATAYTWLTLATIGYCALALAGGAGIGAGSGAGTIARATGVLLTLFIFGGLAYGGFVVFTRYQAGYPVEYLRAGMGGLALLAAAIGLALSPQGRGLRRITRLASYSLILSAIASVTGAYLWKQAGAIEPQYTTPAMLGLIFAAHSLWGWLLLIFSFRI